MREDQSYALDRALVRQLNEQVVLDHAREVLYGRLTASNTDILGSPSVVRDYLQAALSELEHEVFCVLFVDSQHRLIALEEMFRGTLTQASVYPREVVKAALSHNACAVIFAHNHPSGFCEPSNADVSLTKQLKAALALIDVSVLDHFVIGNDKSLSFAEKGLI